MQNAKHKTVFNFIHRFYSHCLLLWRINKIANEWEVMNETTTQQLLTFQNILLLFCFVTIIFFVFLSRKMSSLFNALNHV